jgi:hypothetical protein
MNQMNMRKASSIAAVILLPLIAFGQETAADQADKDLRARVTEFLQYHVDGNFRKAYDMVAEDTKDQYFASGKVQIKGFKINGVEFTDNFARATVTCSLSKTVPIAGQEFPVTVPSITTWKIENGKWVWYADPKADTWATPVGPSLPPSPAQNAAPAAADEIPKNLDDKAIAAAAQSILQGLSADKQALSIDKKAITLDAAKVSEGKVIFHNGTPGSVQLELTSPEVPGFGVTIAQSIVRATSDMPILFHYEPVDQSRSIEPITVRITVQPLNQVFVVRVDFTSAAPLR